MSQDKVKLSLSSALPTSRKRNRNQGHDESKNNKDTQQKNFSTSNDSNNVNNMNRDSSSHPQQRRGTGRARGRGKGRGDGGYQQRRNKNYHNNNRNQRDQYHNHDRAFHHHDHNQQQHHHQHHKNRRRDQDPMHIDTPSISSVPTSQADVISNHSGPLRSIEGWIVIATDVHEEAQEEDVRDIFSEYGKINNIRVNLDTLTGFCKGYALIEYTQKSEAQDAINALHGKEFLGKTIRVNWAFVGGGSVSIDDRSGESPNKKMKCGRR